MSDEDTEDNGETDEETAEESTAQPSEDTTPEAANGNDADAEASGDEPEDEPATEPETDESEEPDADEDAGDNGESDEEDADEEGESDDDLPAQSLAERLGDAEDDLEAAETESDLDGVESTLDGIESDLEAADLPEPDEDEDDPEDPREELESRLEDLRDALEEARGPYAEDVTNDLDDLRETIADTRWTDQGRGDVAEAVEAYLGDVEGILDAAGAQGVRTDGGENADNEDDEGESESPAFEYETATVEVERDIDSLVAALDDAENAIADADFDPDSDEAVIEALLGATQEFREAIENAQAFSDLSTREKLAYEGFYDVLTAENRKDFPPEWNAIKIYERQGEIEPIMLAFEQLGSEYMEEHCMEAFGRMGASEAFEPMHQRAQRRKMLPITVLGKIGDDRALETLHPYIEGDSDPRLQYVTIKTIGEIGSTDSTQAVADRLVSDDAEIRSRAARALGKIGDTRAIAPLSDLLSDDDSDTVRASAAWALNQIGTREALEAANEHAEDRSYLVQTEAQQATRALGENGEGEPEPEQPA